MALISASNHSVFPGAIDIFVPAVDGLGISSIINADRWNKLEHALYKIQNHIQKIPHFATDADRKRVRLETTFTLAASTGLYIVTFTLSTPQFNFLDNQPFRFGNMFLADAWRLDTGGLDYFTDIRPVEPNQVQVRVRRLNPNVDLTAGTYAVKLTCIGL